MLDVNLHGSLPYHDLQQVTLSGDAEWPKVADAVIEAPLVISWRPEFPALLTAFPRAAMLILIVGIAQTEAFVLHLAPSTPSQRKKRCITTNPLVITRRFDQRR